jgi:DNA polymerase
VLRNIFIPAPGLKFCDYDFSKIEPIAAASLSGFTERLEMIQKGVDLYKVAAATIFGTTTDKVTKTQRQVGKVAELLCIAEGTPVLTHRGEVPIELVKAICFGMESSG